MYKKCMIIAVVMAVCFMTACTRKTDSEEGVVGAAVEDNGYQEDRTNENEAEILTACIDTKIEQTVPAVGGTSLLISADVNVEGITRVSQYEYVLMDITEEGRADLFQSVFPEIADQAEYDELNDVWTLDIDPDIRNYFLYQISYSNGGATIPGEQIIVFENRYYDLYPFEDNRLGSVLGSGVNASLDEAESVCRKVV